MRILRTLFQFVMLCALVMVPLGAGWGQTSSWEAPVNLSRSGAASQPRLLVALDGRMQVFWWDRFDGLMTVVFDGTTWSEALLAPLPWATLSGVPEMILDASGFVHAFWLNQDGALLHSRLLFGNVQWTMPEVLAESALVFKVSMSPQGALSLAYLNSKQSLQAAAGLYFRRLQAGALLWTPAVQLYASRYYRLLTAEQAWLSLLDLGEAGLYVAWQDREFNQVFFAVSGDGGRSWSQAQVLEQEVHQPIAPRLAALPDGNALLIWQGGSIAPCVLYQQVWSEAEGWTQAERLPFELPVCPGMGHFEVWDGRLFWFWEHSGNGLEMAAWDPSHQQWSEVQNLQLDFSLVDGTAMQWAEYQVALQEGKLILIGRDGNSGDVWITKSQAGVLELVFPPAPPWSGMQRLSLSGKAAADPALAMDVQGRLHLVWCEGAASGPAQVIYYLRWDGRALSRPSAIQGGVEGEMVRQPALLADEQGWLHLAWSGGEQGEILYSRARLDEAGLLAGWAPVQKLSSGSVAAWPQLASDVAGRLYLLYVVPLNEGRGVYLIRSADNGETWEKPALVFDAAAAGWTMVGRPALAVTPSLRLANHAELHVAWVQATQPGTWPALGIYYTRAATSLISPDEIVWSEPFHVAEANYDWPRLLASGGKINLFYTAVSGGLWQRSLDLDSDAADVASWGTALRVPGWQDSGSGIAFSPVGVAADGALLDGSIYLAGAALSSEGSEASLELLFSAWDGLRWGPLERYRLSLWAGEPLGAAAVTPAEGGILVLAWLSLDEVDLPTLYVAWRDVPTIEVPPLPTPQPTPTPQPMLAIATIPAIAPSPTPDLNQVPPPGSGLPLPPILGIGLAAILVVGVFVAMRTGVKR